MKKIGPNFEDRNRIKEWAEQGKSAQEISDRVLVEVAAVQRTMDSLKPKESELTRGQKAAATRKANKAQREQEEAEGESSTTAA